MGDGVVDAVPVELRLVSIWALCIILIMYQDILTRYVLTACLCIHLLTLIQIYSNYACVLRRTGHLDRAVEWYRLSLALNPQDPDTHSSLGFTYHLLRRYVLAKGVYVGYMCV